MRQTAHVMPEDEFTAWLDKKGKAGGDAAAGGGSGGAAAARRRGAVRVQRLRRLPHARGGGHDRADRARTSTRR